MLCDYYYIYLVFYDIKYILWHKKSIFDRISFNIFLTKNYLEEKFSKMQSILINIVQILWLRSILINIVQILRLRSILILFNYDCEVF